MVMRLTDMGHYQPMFETSQGDNCLEQVELTPRVRLMGDFLYKGDFAVLCGAEGSGKSILAFQLADALSRGKPVEGFANECERQRVLFLDFENKHERFIRRYSQEGQNKYKLSSGFFRTTFSSKFTEYVGLRKEFHVEMNRRITGREPEVLIVNNLDVAKCFVSEAFLIALLKEYQARLNLTVVLVTSINPGKTPVYLNRLGKNLRAMADSVIAIGHSKKAKNIRYLKQLKSSTGETTYDENELPEFTIEKRDNFTGFYHNGFGWEDEHLSGPPEGLDLDIINLKNQQPNLTYKEIADKLETNKTRVMRALDRELSRLSDCADGGKSERGLNRLRDCTDGGKFERGLSILKDCTDGGKFEQSIGAVVTSNLENDGNGSAILCHAEAEGRLEARQRIVGMEGKPDSLERGLNRLRDCAEGGKFEQSVGAVVTSNLENDGNGSAILCHAEAEGRLEARQRIVGMEGKPDSFERGLSRLRDCTDGGKFEQSIGAVVTSALNNNTATDAPSFSNPRLQPGGEEHHTDSLHQGNDTPNHTKTPAPPSPTDPFRGSVEHSGHPSEPGVKFEHGLRGLEDFAEGNPITVPCAEEETLEQSLKTLDALISSYCKPQPEKKNTGPGTQNKKTSYSQELKKRLAQARLTKKK